MKTIKMNLNAVIATPVNLIFRRYFLSAILALIIPALALGTGTGSSDLDPTGAACISNEATNSSSIISIISMSSSTRKNVVTPSATPVSIISITSSAAINILPAVGPAWSGKGFSTVFNYNSSARLSRNLRKDSIPAERPKIALFAPLYLDSAFSFNGEYRYGKQFPRFFSPGLEFYEGAQLALDSLQKEGISMEVNVYDTRSGKSINEIVSSPQFQGTGLIIAHLSSYNEVGAFARIAREKEIPFINATLPNDAAITKNPYFVILNSTLRAHCEAIYKHLQKKFPTARIVAFQKQGTQENTLREYFNDIEKNTSSTPVKLKFVNLPTGFSSAQLLPYLDSAETTICIGASLDENFAKTLAQELASVYNPYRSELIGMPTWDAISFDKKEFEGLEIIYTTPFYNPRTDSLSVAINDHFNSSIYARPSDMVFRGYECIYHFGRLLSEHGKNLSSAIGEKKYPVFTDFDIQPVFLTGPSQGIDYFENKKLYFIKKLNGVIKEVK